MGKRIRVQRRGRGAPTFRSSTHKRVAPARYPSAIRVKENFDSVVHGVIEDFVHDPGRGSPLALIRFETGETCYTVVPEGVYAGGRIQIGGKA
jgi:large subunit ribosomal protein L2